MFPTVCCRLCLYPILSLEVLKNHGDLALRVMVSGYGGEELMVELGDLSCLSHFNDSVILHHPIEYPVLHACVLFPSEA